MSTNTYIDNLYSQSENYYNSGKAKLAEKSLKRILKKNASHLDSRMLLTKLFLENGKLDQAERVIRRTLTLRQNLQENLYDLAKILFAKNNFSETVECCEQGLNLKSNSYRFELYLLKGEALNKLGDLQDAERCFQAGLSEAQNDTEKLKNYCLKMFSLGYYRKTLNVTNKLSLLKDKKFFSEMAGKCFLELHDPKQAEKMFLDALRSNPGQSDNYVGLSSAYAAQGRNEAAKLASQELAKNLPSYTRFGIGASRNILVLQALGDNYFTKKDPNQRPPYGAKAYIRENGISQIKPRLYNYYHCYIDFINSASAFKSMKQIDLIYNNVVNAELATRYKLTEKIEAIIGDLEIPIVNSPQNVALSSRALNFKRLSKIIGIKFPKTEAYNFEEEQIEHCLENIITGFDFPIIVRKDDSHQNKEALLIESQEQLELILPELANENFYVIEFINNPFKNGIYRKFRCFIIDGEFCQRSIYFSDNWNVHDSSFASDKDELIKLDKAYINDPISVLGDNNVKNILKVGEIIGLDFLGIDFDLMKDGSLLIYEANACMNIESANYSSYYPYHKNIARKNFQKLEDMFANRIKCNQI